MREGHVWSIADTRKHARGGPMTPHLTTSRWWLALLLLGVTIPSVLAAQSTSGYPVRPKPLPDEEEIALARSAAPPEISDRADVYVLRAEGAVKLRTGTNGAACIVTRDLHEGSLYPICFD